MSADIPMAADSESEQGEHIPYKQIRARQPTPDTIIVYQAYSAEIAGPAVAQQRLDASEAFRVGRMTWVKPSFLWCIASSLTHI
jgi:hypothetical protein